MGNHDVRKVGEGYVNDRQIDVGYEFSNSLDVCDCDMTEAFWSHARLEIKLNLM